MTTPEAIKESIVLTDKLIEAMVAQNVEGGPLNELLAQRAVLVHALKELAVGEAISAIMTS